jgi:hypothetical protein
VIDKETLDTIWRRANELADEAPPFSVEQAQLLHSLWVRYSGAPASDSGSAA